MKKASLLFWAALLPLGILFGQTTAANDPAAKKILDAVSAKLKSFTSLQATFTYKIENAAGKLLSSKPGTLTMKGTKYKLVFSDQVIICNGVAMWNIDIASNEVVITTLDASGDMISPQKLFSNFYDKDFLYVYKGEKKVGTKQVQEIQLTPTDKTKNFHSVYLQIDKATNTMYNTLIMENAGNRYTCTVSSMLANPVAADALFVFDKSKYPGISIEDLR